MFPQVPLRTSLPDQLVAILREGISEGRWRDELPSETALSREFQVSRMTLRKAIAQLAHEGWITLGGRGHQHSIQQARSGVLKSTGQIIRVLTPYSLPTMGAVNHSILETLAERIATAGYRLEFEFRPGLFQHHQPVELQRLDSLPDTAGWLLFYSTKQMQQWFTTSGRPCVVAGSLYEGVHLSCVYPETPSAARHAAGRFYARGHRELVYLIAELTSLGDRRASIAFVDEARRLGANARVIKHKGDMASVHRVLMDLAAMRPRPSALFTGSPECGLTALCFFLGLGVRIPADVAIIAGWNDTYLDHTIPTIARYSVDGIKMGRKIAGIFRDMFNHGTGKIRSIGILPEFVPGGTLEEGGEAKANCKIVSFPTARRHAVQ